MYKGPDPAGKMEIAAKTTRASKSRERRRGRLWWATFVTALLGAAAAYYYVVDFYDPTKNFLRQLGLLVTDPVYTFFSGSTGGFYIKIGDLVEGQAKKSLGVRIQSIPSPGAFANSTSVMHTPLSFGLVQEDTLAQDDFIREHVNFVVPLYMERLHILYRVKKYRESGALGQHGPYLSISPDVSTLRFFDNAVVSTGPAGSGTKVFASYILEASGVRPKRLLSMGFSDALEQLKAEEIDVVMTLAGAPLVRVLELLYEKSGRRSAEYGLIGIDPALVQVVNARFHLGLRSTSFAHKYEGWYQTPTVGTYAFLITSKDVPSTITLGVLSILNGKQEQLLEELKSELPPNWSNKLKDELIRGASDESQRFQLDEFDFFGAFTLHFGPAVSGSLPGAQLGSSSNDPDWVRLVDEERAVGPPLAS